MGLRGWVPARQGLHRHQNSHGDDTWDMLLTSKPLSKGLSFTRSSSKRQTNLTQPIRSLGLT